MKGHFKPRCYPASTQIPSVHSECSGTECPNWLFRLAIKSTSEKSGIKPGMGSMANVLWFVPPVRFTRIISRNLSQVTSSSMLHVSMKVRVNFSTLSRGSSLIPVLWAERWSPPPVWSPCWTCPATACPPPVAWSKTHCWPGSDNCLHCWGAEKHLHLNGQEQQNRKHHCFVNHSKTTSSLLNRKYFLETRVCADLKGHQQPKDVPWHHPICLIEIPFAESWWNALGRPGFGKHSFR